MNQRF